MPSTMPERNRKTEKMKNERNRTMPSTTTVVPSETFTTTTQITPNLQIHAETPPPPPDNNT
jgi:hypothetical protein